MAIESATTLAGLNPAWPLGTDPKSEGDDHIRLIKSLLKTNFPSTVTADIGFGVRNTPDRWVWNDKVNLTGTDVMILTDTGLLTTLGNIVDKGGTLTVQHLVAGSNPSLQFMNSLGTSLGFCFYDTTNNLATLSNNFGGTGTLTLNNTGNLTVNGSISAASIFQSSGVTHIVATTGAGTIYLRPNGSGLTTGEASLNSAGNFTVSGTMTAGQYQSSGANAILATVGAGTVFLRPNGVGSTVGQATQDSSGNFVITGSVGQKATGTTWANPSDVRMKNISGDYAKGLAELLMVQPKVFTFKENPDLGEVIGCIAQEVEPVFPECITSAPGEIAGQHVEDLRSFDASPMIFALINAVRDLSARIDELEAMVVP